MDFSNRPANRTWLCSVVFMDIIGYTKHPLTQQIAMKNCFNEHVTTIANKHFSETDLIVVDSGDGGALCYLGDPEDMLFCSRDLMEAFEANGDIDLPVRIGINLGPVKIHTSVAGQPNPIGDGINVAQRVMSFAEAGQIMISRSFYEVVGCLSEENSYMFEHVGIRSDKHIRKHDLYRIRTSQEVADVISSIDDHAHDYYTANEDITEDTREGGRERSNEAINENDLSIPAVSATHNQETNESIPPPLQVDTSSVQVAQERQQLENKIKTALISHIGPIAKIFVRTEFKANRPAEQMIHNLCSHISEEAERTRFQTVMQGLLKNSQHNEAAVGDGSTDTTTNEEDSKNWDQNELESATNHLLPYMGPVAKILVKKTARHSADIEALYQGLAKHIANKSERKAFLKQMGLQEKKP